MRINTISNNYSHRTSSPNFSSNTRHVLDKSGKVLYKNTTTFFRNDVIWKRFSKFLDKFYAPVAKVNVFNFACSDGSEPWSLAISLLEQLKEKSEKFFPIMASDVDKEIIAKAQNEPCPVSQVDLYNINSMTRDGFSKYFSCHRVNDNNYIFGLRPKEILNKRVKFSQANIFEEISKIPPKNNLILCRNFWVYLSEKSREELAKLLSKHLDDSSLVMIGALDVGYNINKLLEKYGFEETAEFNIFQKKTKL